MVTNAVRPPALFAATLTVTDPLPVPLDPDATVSQLESLLAAVHEHQLPDVTAIVAVPPALVNDWLDGEIVVPQGAAACDAGPVCPATVMVVDRAAPAFVAAPSATVPDPVPVAPLVTVSQLVSALDAVQVQVGPVVTLIDAEPASDVNVAFVGDTV